jgi:hypothetical protein
MDDRNEVRRTDGERVGHVGMDVPALMRDAPFVPDLHVDDGHPAEMDGRVVRFRMYEAARSTGRRACLGLGRGA